MSEQDPLLALLRDRLSALVPSGPYRDLLWVALVLVLGAIGIYVKKRIDLLAEKPGKQVERRQKQEDDLAKDKAAGLKETRGRAREGCQRLLELVAEWENAVEAAVRSGDTAQETCEAIATSIATNKFNYRLLRELPSVSADLVPDCGDVALLSVRFALSALRKKSADWQTLSPGEPLPDHVTAYIRREAKIFCDQVAEEADAAKREAFAHEVTALLRTVVYRPAPSALEDELVGVMRMPGPSYDGDGPDRFAREYELRKPMASRALLDLGTDLKLELTRALRRVAA